MLKIYNTESRKIEVFKPINDKMVTIYVCGPTVYSNIHIGNARPVIFFDMVKNYLLYKGYQVNYVSNITDVDDKIIEEAKRLNISESELTTEFTNAFIDASLKVGSKLPDFMPKATNYIVEMIKYISELISSGYAYATKSGVYFRTKKIDNYGSISNQKLDELEASVRIENKSDKEDFRDFTLWKNTTEGLSFESPWGVGRPGWHTECAVMNHEIFDGTIDIHGGGSDLIFPHHENENAQTLAHSNYNLANYWMHVGRLDLDNTKMSKSLGNTVLVKDLLDPISFRLLILAHNYRNPINYSNELLEEFSNMYDRIVRTIKRTLIRINMSDETDLINDELMDMFNKHMDDDFNTPNVVTLILDIIKDLNKPNNDKETNMLYNTLINILNVLGINPNITLSNDIIELHSKWNEARSNKDYALADLYRNELTEKGWI
ncbi:MAG TPA: cysteine--tRNA ligase [Haploplasma sp.]|nr:cysteine--tRNA ligase [Haploplasma sp.]